jgi:hypothetical protein
MPGRCAVPGPHATCHLDARFTATASCTRAAPLTTRPCTYPAHQHEHRQEPGSLGNSRWALPDGDRSSVRVAHRYPTDGAVGSLAPQSNGAPPERGQGAVRSAGARDQAMHGRRRVELPRQLQHHQHRRADDRMKVQRPDRGLGPTSAAHRPCRVDRWLSARTTAPLGVAQRADQQHARHVARCGRLITAPPALDGTISMGPMPPLWLVAITPSACASRRQPKPRTTRTNCPGRSSALVSA